MVHKAISVDAILYDSMLSSLSQYFSRTYHHSVHFFTQHKTTTAVLFVALTVGVFYYIFSAPKVTSETFSTAYGPLKQYVKVTGQVQVSKDANLSFQTSGAVSYVGIKVGDKVEQGKVLATLAGSDAQASLLQAQANLSSTQAVLEQLQQGARVEEIAIKEQILASAKNSLDQSYAALPDSVQNVDAITADVIKNKFSSLFILSNGRYLLSFSSCNQRLQSEIETKRTALENSLAEFQKKSSVITAISSTDNVDATFEAGYQAALLTNDLVNSVSNLLLTSCSISNPNLEVYRVTLSAVKTSMTALFSDITAKRSALNIAKNTFNQASRDLDLTKAGTDPYKIKSQTALVAQAEAQVAQARSGLAKTMIVSPFSGFISNVELSIGETVTVGKTIISMIALDGYEVEAKIPEIDIVKIKVGQDVEVTLDAYGKGINFPATITRINPTATTEGTVPVYKVIVTFLGKDTRIKQGMTANVQIITNSKTSIITVPSRFITLISQEKGSVTVLANGKQIVKDLTLGIRGDDGSIEVIGGLVEGDVLVSPLTVNRQAQKQTAK